MYATSLKTDTIMPGTFCLGMNYSVLQRSYATYMRPGMSRDVINRAQQLCQP